MHVRIGRTHTQSVDYWPKYSTQACTIHCARLAHRTVATLVGCRAYQLSVNGRQIGSGVDIKRVLPRDAMQARPLLSCSVRLSVRLSRSWITSKRIKISLKFFHHRATTPFYFFHPKEGADIPTGTP